MSYDELIEGVVRWVEAVGAAIMVVGGAGALVAFAPRIARRATREGSYQELRGVLGRIILLGLEVLIIGDIIRTIAVEPTPSSVLVLGAIVVIRIVLSFAIEVEIDGRWPWAQGRQVASATGERGAGS